MSSARLDPALLEKIAKRMGTTIKSVREKVSRSASREGIPSEAALIRLAQAHGIGAAAALRQLPPHVQTQVGGTLSNGNGHRALPAPRRARARRPQHSVAVLRGQTLKLVIRALLSDDELHRRCAGMLRDNHGYDRAFREATTVLDDRLKKLGGITEPTNPHEVVATVLHPGQGPGGRPRLVTSAIKNEQLGFFHTCNGIMGAFRNPAHHGLDDQLTREDALRFCGFINTLLLAVGRAERNLPT